MVMGKGKGARAMGEGIFAIVEVIHSVIFLIMLVIS